MIDFIEFLKNYVYEDKTTYIENIVLNDKKNTYYINEYWTLKQRQSNPLHEISYRACFKPELPRFFIEKLTKEGDVVYDPFSGRGTTVIEAGLLNRNIIMNDINPLSNILIKPRFNIPNLDEIEKRLENIQYDYSLQSDIDLSMFYEKKTESEIVFLKNYFKVKKNKDHVDEWIQMVSTNRLTGHSSGFFSVYSLPPNQATTQKRQIKINESKKQTPEYRNTKDIIIKKSKSLLKEIDNNVITRMQKIYKNSLFINEDAGKTKQIESDSVNLVVTSPPFLDVVRYDNDNWLRCWFNSINMVEISKKITMSNKMNDWIIKMDSVFKELYRVLKNEGWIIFEVGEVRKGKYNLEDFILPICTKYNFKVHGVMINEQNFTKTSNIWGINNNKKGTNTNRMILIQK